MDRTTRRPPRTKTSGRGRRVLLLQLPVPLPGAVELTGNVPLGPASLILHARAVGVPADVDLVPQEVASRLGDAALLRHLERTRPDVLGLTCTVWNVERSIYLARALKERLPEVEVWAGGPEVAADAFFVGAPETPFGRLFEGEGEVAFAAALGAPAAPPLRDLATVHDPYLAGLVRPERDGVLLTEWGRGCRWRCAFCRYHHGRRGPAIVRPLPLVGEVLDHARARGLRELYLLDPSLEQRRDLEHFLTFVAGRNRDPQVPLQVELRADLVDRRLAALLARAGVRRVEAGLQTVTPEALRLAGRSPDSAAFVRGVEALEAEGVAVKIDLMVGLPGDSPRGFRRTVDLLLAHNLEGRLQAFRTQVLPGTALRARAARLGVVYQDRPPYHVLETRTWPRERLAFALEELEYAMGQDFAAGEDPALARPAPDAACERRRYPGVQAQHQLSFDLAREAGRRALARERFEGVGSAVTLWLHAPEPTLHRATLARAVRRLLTANPFATLVVVLACAPGAPLDAFDDLDRAMDEGRLSAYADEAYRSPGPRTRPGRRLFAAFEAGARVDDGWLEALRSVAEVVWLARVRDLAEGAERVRALALPPGDYLYVDGPEVPEEPGERELETLAAAAQRPEALLLRALGPQWAWQRHLARRAGSDW